MDVLSKLCVPCPPFAISGSTMIYCPIQRCRHTNEDQWDPIWIVGSSHLLKPGKEMQFLCTTKDYCRGWDNPGVLDCCAFWMCPCQTGNQENMKTGKPKAALSLVIMVPGKCHHLLLWSPCFFPSPRNSLMWQTSTTVHTKMGKRWLDVAHLSCVQWKRLLPQVPRVKKQTKNLRFHYSPYFSL